MNESLKVQPHHLERGAYLYIRQSSMRQVIENVESTKRQYALVKRRCVEAATMDYATRQVAKVAGASPRVKSGLIANSSTDTPSKLTS